MIVTKNYIWGKTYWNVTFSINMIVWFGATFKEFGGVCPKGENDEEYFQ